MTYFMTGSLYLLILFTHVAHSSTLLRIISADETIDGFLNDAQKVFLQSDPYLDSWREEGANRITFAFKASFC